MAMWRSKLGNQYPKAQVEKLDREHHAVLKQLRALPENSKCAECGSSDTTWASVNLGVFVCMPCADVHRHIGTHISKMKGCGGTYLWGPDEIEQMKSVGNRRALESFCARGAPSMSKGSSKDELVDFCTKKYSALLWASDELKNLLAQGGKISSIFAKSRENVPQEQTSRAPCIFQKSNSHRALATKCSPSKVAAKDTLPILLGEGPKVGRQIPDSGIDWDAIFFAFPDDAGHSNKPTRQVPATNVSASGTNSVAGLTLNNDLESCFCSQPAVSTPVTTQPSLGIAPPSPYSLPCKAAVPDRQPIASATLPSEAQQKSASLNMDTFFADWGL